MSSPSITTPAGQSPAVPALEPDRTVRTLSAQLGITGFRTVEPRVVLYNRPPPTPPPNKGGSSITPSIPPPPPTAATAMSSVSTRSVDAVATPSRPSLPSEQRGAIHHENLHTGITTSSGAAASTTTTTAAVPPAPVFSLHEKLQRLAQELDQRRQEQAFRTTAVKPGQNFGKGAPSWARHAAKRPREAAGGGTTGSATPAAASAGESRLREPTVVGGDDEHVTGDVAQPRPQSSVPVASTVSVGLPQLPQRHSRASDSARSANDAPRSVRREDNGGGEEGKEKATASDPKPQTTRRKRVAGKAGGDGDARGISDHARSSSSIGTGRHTLFQTTRPDGAESCGPAAATFSATYELVDRFDELLDSIAQDVADPMRIQAPLVGVAVVRKDGDNNFSLCVDALSSASGATPSAPSPADRRRFPISNRAQYSEQLSHLVVCWKENLVVIPWSLGLRFLLAMGDLGDVTIVSFHVEELYLAVLAACLAPMERLQLRPLQDKVIDVRVMAWMLDPAQSCADFDMLAQQYHPHYRSPASPLASLGGCCDRLLQTMTLYRRLYGSLGTRGLLQPLLRQERAISFLCAAMKFDGFLVDCSEVEESKRAASEELAGLQQRALSFVQPSGMDHFNPQSPDDCRHALYTILRLHEKLSSSTSSSSTEFSAAAVVGGGAHSSDGCGQHTTKTGKLSTAEDTLKLLAPLHPLPSVIMAYRKTAKLLQTYVEGILDSAAPIRVEEFARELGESERCVDLKTISMDEYLLDAASYDAQAAKQRQWATRLRRVHATFCQEGTDTGRLSCFGPNLQNLPRCSEVSHSDSLQQQQQQPPRGLQAGSIRRAFVPLPGCTLVALDYEQIEIRLLAHLSGDAELVRSLGGGNSGNLDGGDIHRKIAAVIFRKAPAAVTPEERTLAKRVVFGVLYGMGPRALAAQINDTVERAQHIQHLLCQGFPQLERYMQRVLLSCRQEGLVRTLMGRVRILTDIDDPAPAKRSLAERQAFNTVIQGSAADVMKKAMIAVQTQILFHPEYQGRVRLHCQVHDELVFSVPTEMMSVVIPKIVDAMVQCVSLMVPLRVAVKCGVSYGALMPWSPN